MKKYIVIILMNGSLISSLFSNNLSDSLCLSKYKFKKESSLFLFTAGYRMPVNNNAIINSGHGLYFEGGINPGRLISKDLVLGVYVGWAFMDRLWATSFNKNFSNDYGASIDKERNFSDLDKEVINSTADLLTSKNGNAFIMPGCEMSSFHNYSLYYGLVIKLPYKYIPILKLYAGTTRSHYQGDGNIATKKKDFNIFELRRPMYGCELIVFKGIEGLLKKKNLKQQSNRNTGALSIYFESCNFNKSSLYFYDGERTTDIALKRFTSNSFLNKYKNEISFGFKLSFNVM